MITSSVIQLLEKPTAARLSLMDSQHESAFRLFNGFTEGYPDLTLDIYARTLVIHNYTDDPAQNQTLIHEVTSYMQNALNWLHVGILKVRNGKTQAGKKGSLIK